MIQENLVALCACDRVEFRTGGKNVKTFYVSECDRVSVGKYTWYMRGEYPNSCKVGTLHVFIMGDRPSDVPEDYVIDHANRNKLDSTRGNLRWVSESFNHWNVRPTKPGTSKFNGVHWNGATRKWRAVPIGKYAGSFDDEREAGKVAAKIVLRAFGEWALNSDLLVGPDLFTEDEIKDLYMEVQNEGEPAMLPPRQLPKGVSKHQNKYVAEYRGNKLGRFDTPAEAKVCYDNAVKAAYDREWNEHTSRQIPRDEDGDAVIALTGKGAGKFSKVPEHLFYQLTFRRKGWNICSKDKYAVGFWQGKQTTLHQVVWTFLHPDYVANKTHSIDHVVPEETLNNLETNLRLATHSEQQRNQTKRQGCTSRFKNVYYCRSREKWVAVVTIQGTTHRTFCQTEEEAVLIADQMWRDLLGEQSSSV
jgi:hypothetical protein